MMTLASRTFQIMRDCLAYTNNVFRIASMMRCLAAVEFRRLDHGPISFLANDQKAP